MMESAAGIIPILPGNDTKEITPSSSPLKKSQAQQVKPKHQLQLFSNSHKNDLTAIFKGLYKFRLTDQDQKCVNVNDTEESKDQEVELQTLEEDETSLPELTPDSDATVEELNSKQCTICECTFASNATAAEKRQHYRLDWHRYNVKRRAHGQIPVNELEFDDIVDGLSSISGSDDSASESEEDTSTSGAITKLMSKVEIASREITTATRGSTIVSKNTNKSEQRLKGSPKMPFQNCDDDIVLIYKAILPLEVLSAEEFTFVNSVDLGSYFYLERAPTWAVIMLSGGHFAAAIVQGATELRRKTFHSYTIRAKQGGSQGSYDSKSGTSNAKSAGASLRRYNEASFTQHIQDLLESWKSDLDSCDFIFYHALSSNKRILFGGKSPPLLKTNPKLRTIPFPTKRPTNSEVKRIVTFLSAIQVYGKDEFLTHFVKPKETSLKSRPASESPTKNRRNKKSSGATIDRARSRSPKKREEPERPAESTPEESEGDFYIYEVDEEINFAEELEEYGDSLTSKEREHGRQMLGLSTSHQPQKKTKVKVKKVKPPEFEKPKGVYDELLKAMESSEKDSEQILVILERVGALESNELNQLIDEHNSTFLHLATKQSLLDVIWKLMELGVNPVVKDKIGKYPYNYADNKECRNVFRKFRATFPDKYDYQKSQIPEPLTEELEKQKVEKKALQNKLKREKEKQKKAEQFEKKKELEEKERFLNLSDREKRALAAERRILGEYKHSNETKPILVRCFDCAIDITGKIPFEYNKNVFCSTKCLAAHRKKFPTPLSV